MKVVPTGVMIVEFRHSFSEAGALIDGALLRRLKRLSRYVRRPSQEKVVLGGCCHLVMSVRIEENVVDCDTES
jgi:hypothetical protein